jgi:ADP-heptose:LPS heptosyltransferase/GT2 family glycosyltransferase
VCATPLASLTVWLDGRELGQAQLGLERPDVGNLFAAWPHARRPGFTFEQTIGPPTAGEHRVLLRLARDDGQVHETTMTVVTSDEIVETPASPADDARRRLEIDAPPLIDGVAAAPVRANLEISGWALARDGVEAIEIGIDGSPLAIADYGLRRLDIRAAFPDWENALGSGYTVVVPHRLLPVGTHRISVALRDKAGGVTRREFLIEVEELPETSGPWTLRRRMPRTEIDLGLRLVDRAGERPVFNAIMPVPGTKAGQDQARRTIASLRDQAYANWRLLLVVGPQPPREALAEMLAGSADLRDRLVAIAAINPQIVARYAGFFSTLSPGDELGCDAFLEMAITAAAHPDADFFYSDERRVNPATGEIGAFFKPQWSPDLLLSTNYVGRLWCARAALLRSALDPAAQAVNHQEYDLVLRCTEKARRIVHVPAVLCERPPEQANITAGKQALERALARRGIVGEVHATDPAATYRVERTLARPGLVSIVIPTCAADGLIETCLTTLRTVTAYRDYEIVVIENIPRKDRKWRDWVRRHADTVIAATEPFNWARFNNIAVAKTRGEYLLFLNDDIEITDPHWLDGLLEHAQRAEVGVVGPRLLYPDGRVQHAGMFLAELGQARHAFRYDGAEEPGYFGLARTQRNVIAVTGACLMTRRETFDRLGGFDETQSIVNNDLDFCLRAWRDGMVNIYTPHVSLTHHEAVSRAGMDDLYDAEVFDSKWRDLFLAGDPYFNPHLSKWADDFSIDYEPTKIIVTGRPVYRRDEIRKILVVKLDHIGDCVIALPAVRRLKQHFPAASITVLTSNSSRPVWSLEPCVDKTIIFNFFHARSGLGELKRTEEDWQELQARLAPEQFDLAIDLRKHLETRPALQYTGARYLAGFDHRDQFPWLDIVLEAEADQAFARKRHHNGDDLVNLVEAVAAASGDDRLAIRVQPAAAPALDTLPAEFAGVGPLVCVHPTVGNDARQWPAEYFAAVIDRLVAQDNARIVIIGGPGDEETANRIIGQVERPDAVVSLVGQVPLGDLPGLLAGTSLFVGNNSGPKHIAAGLGVPTVGIHSGTEDVLEWGPIGPNALAVAREVVCAPCYLADAADCRRGLVCLKQLEPARVYEACKRLLPLAMPRGSATSRNVAESGPAAAK